MPTSADFTSNGFIVSVKDLQPILDKYDNMITETVHSDRVLKDMAPVIRDMFKVNFLSEGRRLGGQWPHLKEDTIKRKMKLVAFAAGGGAVGISRGTAFGGGLITRTGGGRFGQPFRSTKRGQAKHVFEPVRLTDRLFDAATGQTADSYLVVTPNRLEVGVKGIPYANLQRHGGGRNVPSRDYLRLTAQDKITLMREVERYIYGAFTLPGLANIEGSRRPKGLGGYVY